MGLLQAGVDRAVIALGSAMNRWRPAQDTYLEANLRNEGGYSGKDNFLARPQLPAW